MKRNLLTLWAKRSVFALALAGITGLTLPSCDKEPKEEPEKKPEPTVETPIDSVKVLTFGNNMGIDSISYENVMKYANDPRITKIIYFNDSSNANNNYAAYETNDISFLRGILQERLDYTPKATGAGTLIFWPGMASVQDSLWFVANGWKIRLWGR